MVEKPRKAKSSQKRRQVTFSICALPEEVKRWREAAMVDDRSFSSWIRSKLNSPDPGGAGKAAAK